MSLFFYLPGFGRSLLHVSAEVVSIPVEEVIPVLVLLFLKHRFDTGRLVLHEGLKRDVGERVDVVGHVWLVVEEKTGRATIW